ncbi:MAG: M24 family metallopeptidase, partial [Methanomassiliicoccaceae archaeon]|nr:M24 family metallopeptidase [Methanomassiliicoccaceae archaeon]
MTQMSRAQRISESCVNVGAVVISNGTSPFLDLTFWYVTEQSSGTFEGSLAIISDGCLDVVTGPLEETTAKKGKGNVHVYRTREERNGIILKLLKGHERIGICGPSVTYNASEYLKRISGAELVDVSSNIDGVMSIKDEKEISEIRKACEISSKTASRIPEMLHDGISEKEMACSIDADMRNNGGSGNAFETIAA